MALNLINQYVVDHSQTIGMISAYLLLLLFFIFLYLKKQQIIDHTAEFMVKWNLWVYKFNKPKEPEQKKPEEIIP